MLTSATVNLTSNTSAVELTSGVDTDQEFELVIRARNISPAGQEVFIGNASVSFGGGYALDASSPTITMRLTGEKVYAVLVMAGSAAVDVLAYSV